MARLVTKFRYLKPDQEKPIGGYVTYIATREGVEKIDESFKLVPASRKQKKLIEKILRDFPDSKEMLEYEDYKREMTVGTASEFITRATEENACEILNQKTYADYIGTRKGVERFGSHGLFTDDGIQVRLNEVSQELNTHGGNVWTLIVSLRREDAERLGFNNGIRWRDMLRTQTEKLADSLKIPMEHLRWYAAFHNESHHPHVHLLAYSTVENEGFLTKQGVHKVRSSLAKDIFSQDLLCMYEKQTTYRDELRLKSREWIAKIVSSVNAGTYDNPAIEERLLRLAERLSRTKGKKVYGYLKADVKALIDSIVDTLAEDERIAALYNLWYEQREAARLVYTEAPLERVPLSRNKEFKPIKNAVIQEALGLYADRKEREDEKPIHIPELEPSEETEPILSDYAESVEMDDSNFSSSGRWRKKKDTWWTDEYKKARTFLYGTKEVKPDFEKARTGLEYEAARGNGFAMHDIGKMLLSGLGCEKDEPAAKEWFTKTHFAFVNREPQEKHPGYLQYRIGKLYSFGYGVEQDYLRAAKWYEKAVAEENPFAAYAQYELGRMCRDGIGTLPDKAASDEWYRRAYQGFLSIEQNMADDKLYYRLGQMNLTGTGTEKNLELAGAYFEKSAEQGNSFAGYQLGKLFLYGRDVVQDMEKAISYLTASASQGNTYAAQLLASIRSNRSWSVALGSLRLLLHLTRMLQSRIENDRRGGSGGVDWKLRRKIDEKKQAHGLKQG